jgi:hypothetical protein
MHSDLMPELEPPHSTWTHRLMVFVWHVVVCCGSWIGSNIVGGCRVAIAPETYLLRRILAGR